MTLKGSSQARHLRGGWYWGRPTRLAVLGRRSQFSLEDTGEMLETPKFVNCSSLARCTENRFSMVWGVGGPNLAVIFVGMSSSHCHQHVLRREGVLILVSMVHTLSPL